MRLEINGKNIDLSSDDQIKYTLQANTLNDLTTRQSNFTPSFKLPKTPNNVAALESLSLVGSNSTVPYRKNDAFLFDNSGEAIISYGWAVIKDTKQEYRCYIYDGIIDFFKAIENKTLTDAGLQELNHLKNLDTVIETWTDLSKPYRYNVADYNGNAIYDLNKLNIDYMIPSANVKYLWDKIFEYIGWTYSGSVFDLEDFVNLWMTYPKTIDSETEQFLNAHVFNWNGPIRYYSTNPNDLTITTSSSFIGGLSQPLLNNDYFLGNEYLTGGFPISAPNAYLRNTRIIVKETGLYKFNVSGVVNRLNQQGSAYSMILTVYEENNDFVQDHVIENTYGDDFETFFYLNMTAGQKFTFNCDIFQFNDASGNVTTDIDFITGNVVDFEEALVNFSINDFVKEILVRFSLTPYPDVLNKNVEFLTLDEILQTENVDDWSDKYQSKTSENYVYGNYGRKNIFSYKYNDSEENYNDSFFTVNNINLKDQVPIFQSKIYSPEKVKTTILNDLVNVYKFYEKELKDDGSVEYKSLENRYYFMKSKIKEYQIQLGSDAFMDTRTSSVYTIEDFSGLSWNAILNNNYNAVNAIINRSKLFKLQMNLNSLDIKKMDFRKLVYIKQQAAYFLKHKISSWKPGNPNTNTELLRLDFSVSNNSIVDLDPQIIISSTITDPNPPITNYSQILTDYAFIDFDPVSATITMKQLDASPLDGGIPTGFQYSGAVDINSNVFLQPLPLLEPYNFGWYEVQIISDNGTESNIVHVFWGNSDTGNTYPNIEVIPEFMGQVFYLEPHQRDISYRFNNFTPTNATLKIQQYDFITGELGEITIVNLTNLTADTLHTLQDVDIPISFGFYEVTLTTNTITFQQIFLFQ